MREGSSIDGRGTWFGIDIVFLLRLFVRKIDPRSTESSSEASEGDCFFLGALFRLFRGTVGGCTTPNSFLRNSRAKGGYPFCDHP